MAVGGWLSARSAPIRRRGLPRGLPCVPGAVLGVVLGFLAALLPVLAGLGAVAAEDDGGDEFYGAIAYSPTNRAHGWAYDYPSRKDAERRALAQCRRHAEDCVIPVWFRNACGALAVGSDGYGSGWGSSRKSAETQAVQSCRRYSGGCAVIRWVCTTH